MDVAARGREFIRVAGPEAAGYLQRMVSNDVEALAPGEACPALLLTAKARVIAPLVVLRRGAGEVRTALNEQPPENCFRPSADVLFRSAASVLGAAAVAIVLTGMTCDRVGDGTAGLRPLKRAGAYVIAQDEATSVVWGMPGSVVAAGLADAVLPLGQIAAAVTSLVGARGAK